MIAYYAAEVTLAELIHQRPDVADVGVQAQIQALQVSAC